MKVVTAKQMADMEARAYQAGYKDEDFMEAAGKGIASAVFNFLQKRSEKEPVILLCGKGNNSGDAYVAGRYLLEKKVMVKAFQIGAIEGSSPLCKKNYDRFIASGGEVQSIAEVSFLSFPDQGVIIDGLFGTGLHSAPKEPYAAVIVKANESKLPIIAIDIPSGLDGDNGKAEGAVIQATQTVFLGLPKRGFFINQGWNQVGALVGVDFGLPKKNVDELPNSMVFFTEQMFLERLPKIKRSRHKYEAGYVVGLAGSPGMPGAANLSAAAALHAGAGIVRLLHPKGMEAELSGSIYELIKTPYDFEDVDEIIGIMNSATATFVGPGIGLSEAAHSLLKAVIPKLLKPCVIDADALTICATENIPLPKVVVMTPHVGEMRRLLHDESKDPVDEAFLARCQEYVDRQGVTLVLKGGPSFVLHPRAPVVVIPYGDPGMATAGSGDVLTGLIAALLAQKLEPYDAAMCGVYIHARAGERAAEELTSFCMVATDIIRHFPDIFKAPKL